MPKRKRFVATLVLHTFEHVLVVLVGVAGLDPQSLVATSSPPASARLWANEFARSTRLASLSGVITSR